MDEGMPRVRINISTSAKGKAQLDITVEQSTMLSEELRNTLEEAFKVARETAEKNGFPVAQE